MDDKTGNQPTAKPIKKGRWHKLELAWDSAFEFLSLTKIGDHLKGEIVAVKTKAPILFIILFLGLCFFAYTSCTKNSEIAKLETENKEIHKRSDDNDMTQKATIGNLSSVIQSNSLSVQVLNQQLRDKEEENQRLIIERNKAQVEAEIAKNGAASWELLAKSSNTNTPLIERLDALTKGVAKNTESLTGALSGSDNIGETFVLKINGQQINSIVTNSVLNSLSASTQIHLDQNREVVIEVINSKDFEVGKVSINFSAPLAATNINIGGTWVGPIPQFFSNRYGEWNNWHIISDDSMTGAATFFATTFNISTNLDRPFFPIYFELNAIGRKRQRYELLFFTF